MAEPDPHDDAAAVDDELPYDEPLAASEAGDAADRADAGEEEPQSSAMDIMGDPDATATSLSSSTVDTIADDYIQVEAEDAQGPSGEHSPLPAAESGHGADGATDGFHLDVLVAQLTACTDLAQLKDLAAQISKEHVDILPEERHRLSQVYERLRARLHVPDQVLDATGLSSPEEREAAAHPAHSQQHPSTVTQQPGRTAQLQENPSPPPRPRLQDVWADMFLRPDYLGCLRNEGMATVLRDRPFRSVSWRLFLGALPEDQTAWAKRLKDARRSYHEKAASAASDPRGAAQRDLPPNMHHPLTEESASAWSTYFEDLELRDVIRRDVTRTFPEEHFFEDPEIQELMIRMLFTYSKLNSDVSYRQGMHELLAALLLVLAKEAAVVHQHPDLELPDCNPDIKAQLRLVLDPTFIEEDTYDLFEHLMIDMKPFFFSDQYRRPEAHHRQTNTQLRFDPFATPFVTKARVRQEEQNQAELDEDPSPLQDKLNWIQYGLLGKAEPTLLQKLRKLDIPPQIYGLRWIRLLLSREFSLADTMIIWDALFAVNQNLELIDYLCVAMLTYIKDYVLTHDYTECLTLLMRFPRVPDVQSLVQKALHLRSPKQFPEPWGWEYDPKSAPAEMRNSAAREGPGLSVMGVFAYAAHRAQELVDYVLPHTQEENSPARLASVEPPAPKDPIEAAAFYKLQHGQLKASNERLAEQLVFALETLQRQFKLALSGAVQDVDRDLVSLTMLEMYQVHDTLQGRLPPDALGFPRTKGLPRTLADTAPLEPLLVRDPVAAAVEAARQSRMKQVLEHEQAVRQRLVEAQAADDERAVRRLELELQLQEEAKSSPWRTTEQATASSLRRHRSERRRQGPRPEELIVVSTSRGASYSGLGAHLDGEDDRANPPPVVLDHAAELARFEVASARLPLEAQKDIEEGAEERLAAAVAQHKKEQQRQHAEQQLSPRKQGGGPAPSPRQ